MSNVNTKLKEMVEGSVYEVIRWAQAVHEDTMKAMMSVEPFDRLADQRFTVYEREEARKIILEYGVGKPTRIVEHRGSKKQPICFNTVIVPTGSAKRLQEAPYVDAEVVDDEYTEKLGDS